MDRFTHIPLIGDIPSLDTVLLATCEASTVLLVRSITPYRRFAVRAADDGLDSFGLRKGSYAVFREQRYPTQECQICLVRFGDEVTMRLLEGIHATFVTLRVSGDKIPPLELEPTDFAVVGVLDGVILEEFARVAEPELQFDWGC